MRVLIVGFAPVAPGYVLMLSKAVPASGGTKLFKLKTMNAFLTGRIPTDCKSLRPKILIFTMYS